MDFGRVFDKVKAWVKWRLASARLLSILLALTLVLTVVPWASVFADEGSAAAVPVVVKPAGDSVYAMGASGRLYIQASSPDGGYLTYAWYRSAKQTSAISHPGGVYGAGDLASLKSGAVDLGADGATLSMTTPTEAGYYYYWCTVTNHVEGDDGLMHTASVDSRPAEVHVVSKTLPDKIMNGDFEMTRNYFPLSSYPVSSNKKFAWNTNYNTELYWNTTEHKQSNGTYATGWHMNDFQSKVNATTTTSYYWRAIETTTNGVGWYPLYPNDDENIKAELCAGNNSALYQTVATTPGKVYEWSLEHAPEYTTDDVSKGALYDTMAVVIGGAVTSAADYTGYSGLTSLYINGAQTEGGLYEYGQNENNLFVKIVQAATGLTSSTNRPSSFDANVYDKAYSVNYMGRNWYVYLCCSNAWRSYSGSYSVPEGQGVTVFAFVALSSKATGAGNQLDNIVFKSGNTMDLATDSAFSGENSISVPTKAGYAYGICEVRGSATTAASGVTVTYDADGSGAGEAVPAVPDGSLPGTSWYAGYADGGVLTFSGLVPGKTYRVAGVPVGAISPADELNTNTDPTQVLDEGYYADTTIPVSVPDTGDQMGNISASLYDNDTKARITMVNANANVQYGLLSFANNEDADPVTAPPVAAWRSPEGGQVVFENLLPNRKYMLIARPYGYSEVTYAVAAATGVVVWTPVGGFAADVSRAQDGTSVTLTNVAGAPEAFNTSSFEYAIYDTATGKLSAAQDGAATITFAGLTKGSTYQVVLRPKSSGQSWADAVRVYPYAVFGIDWAGEAVMAKDAGGALVPVPETIEYRLYANNAQQTWIGGSDAWRAGSGAEGVPLSAKPEWLAGSIFARLAELGATGAKVEYRYKAGYDGYDDDSVSPVATLDVPVRGEGPVLDTDYAFDYANEEVEAKAGKHVEVSKDGGSTWAALPEGGTALSSLGWNGGGGASVLLRKAAESNGDGTGAFASNPTTQAVDAKPAAPSYVRSQKVDDKIKFLGLTAGKNYEWAQPMESGDAAAATWHSFSSATGEYTEAALVYDNDPPSGLDGDYWVREAATGTTFASRHQLVSTALMVVTVDFGTTTYGYDASAAGLTKQVQLINGMPSEDASGDVTVTAITLVGESASAFELYYSGSSGSVSNNAFTGSHVVEAGATDTSFTLKAKSGLAAKNYTAQISVSYTRNTN